MKSQTNLRPRIGLAGGNAQHKNALAGGNARHKNTLAGRLSTHERWWARQDLNPQPNRYERFALTS